MHVLTNEPRCFIGVAFWRPTALPGHGAECLTQLMHHMYLAADCGGLSMETRALEAEIVTKVNLTHGFIRNDVLFCPRHQHLTVMQNISAINNS